MIQNERGVDGDDAHVAIATATSRFASGPRRADRKLTRPPIRAASLTVTLVDFYEAATEASRYAEWLADKKRKAGPPKGKIPDL
jgi:hypothetical protein